MIFSLEYCVHNAIENAPFKIERPEGSYRYLFFHFNTSVTLKYNGENVVLDPGTCILFTPGKPQYFFTEKSRLNHDYLDFILYDNDFFKKIAFPTNKPFNIRNNEFVGNMIKEIVDEKSNENIGSNYMVDSKMIDFFVSLSRKYHHKKTFSYDKYMNEIREEFEKMRLLMYEKPDGLKISSLAQERGFSITRFSTLYKTFFGVTPTEDLKKARISRVRDLLKNGCSTREIIKIVGFSSEEYFYRWFKKNFYVTKEDYVKVFMETEI